MDPGFNATMTEVVQRTAYPLPPQEDDAPTDPPSTDSSLYADQQWEGLGSSVPHQAVTGAQGDDTYARSLNFEERMETGDAPTIQSYANPTHSSADASSDVAPAAATASPPYHPSTGAHSHPPAYHGFASQQTSERTDTVSDPNGAGPGVDFQALLDNLANAAASSSASTAQADPSQAPIDAFYSTQPAPGTDGITSPTSVSLPSHAGLPPKPPPQNKPATHPNYTPNDDIRSYHPHSGGKPPGAAYRSQALPQLLTASGAVAPNGTPAQTAQTAPTMQNTPVSATQRTSSPPTPNNYRQRESLDQRSQQEPLDDEDAPWSPNLQSEYDQFLVDERAYVTEGQWDKFPINSRLFIGKLASQGNGVIPITVPP